MSDKRIKIFHLCKLQLIYLTFFFNLFLSDLFQPAQENSRKRVKLPKHMFAKKRKLEKNQKKKDTQGQKNHQDSNYKGKNFKKDFKKKSLVNKAKVKKK